MPLQLPQWAQHSFVDPLLPSLQVGALTGATGGTLGAAYGIIRNPHPVAFATAAGITAALYGSGTFYIRGAILAAQGAEHTRRSELAASGCAGALTGAVSGATHRSLYSVLRSGFVVGIVGIVGQACYYAFISASRKPAAPTSLVDWIAKGLPVRSIPDSEYAGILHERMIRIDAEIATIDDKIAHLRRQSDSLDSTEP